MSLKSKWDWDFYAKKARWRDEQGKMGEKAGFENVIVDRLVNNVLNNNQIK